MSVFNNLICILLFFNNMYVYVKQFANDFDVVEYGNLLLIRTLDNTYFVTDYYCNKIPKFEQHLLNLLLYVNLGNTYFKVTINQSLIYK